MEPIEIPKTSRTSLIALIIGILGLILSLVAFFANSEHFFHSYLVAFAFWTSIALGGLFLTFLHYLTGAVWSVVLRRIFESFMAVLPVMALFLIPVLLGMYELYHWTHAEAVEQDILLQQKSPYLNIPFFVVRSVLFFVIWSVFARVLYHLSIKNDWTGDATLLKKARRISPLVAILFAITLSFAAFDWLMSLDALWYSTIFGVYYFSGSTVATIALLILFVVMFDKAGFIKNLISIEHYHDLGKLLFTFTVFWAYIAFSQYFLIWYANIPEETIWFAHRWEGAWKSVSLFLVIGHFVLPFFVLMMRSTKRNMAVLVFMSLWLLFMHLVDMYWLVMPNLFHHDVHLSWIDVAPFLGIGGIFVWLAYVQLSRNSLVAINDPKLKESINHRM